YTVNAEHQRKISELTEVTSDMDNLLQGTQIGTIFLDRELKIRKFTPSIASAFHVLDQDIGRPIEHIAYNLDNPELLQDIETVIQGTEIVERKVKSRNGRPFFQRITPYLLPDGEIGGVILTFTDVTAIEEASREAERRAEDLERSNLELIEFAYAVSHDLQSPLRHINDHGRILAEEAKESLNDQARRSLSVMTKGATQLSSMIDALLAYSRIHTRGEPPELVDCHELLDEVKTQLKDQIEYDGATITHDTLPKVYADRNQLKTVFTHLIDNAMRYRRDEDPKIHIEVRRHEDEWQFSFEDNGMGMEPRCFDRIFVIFQRLYRDEEIPGEGVGLALCKRIVERHGGRIWLTSRPGRGSTFYFTLASEEVGQPVQNRLTLPSRKTPR
ncbi:MAG: PAS domain-containing protein, partial [Lacipirellulaceae bacterium]